LRRAGRIRNTDIRRCHLRRILEFRNSYFDWIFNKS
jgi:hypothetical protein